VLPCDETDGARTLPVAMRRTGAALLAAALCLDLAHRSSVDAFLPAPVVLRVSLGHRRPAVSLRRPQPARRAGLPGPAPSHARRCALLQTRAIFGGTAADEEPDIEVPTFFPPADRIVAIGDVHGDVDALSGCLKLSGIIDDNESWIGGTTHLVQLGDILDRGDTERNCIDLLFRLRQEARLAGGQVHILLGNHEVMNVDLDFRYVTNNAWEGWGDAQPTGSVRLDLKASLAVVGFPAYMKQRVQAFRPGGFEAKRLSKMPVAIVIGDTLLVHGGLREKHVKYGVERMNKEMAAWLAGPPKFRGADKPEIIDESDSPIWARLYSTPTPKSSAETELEEVCKALKVKRMVVGHTPQLRGINAFVSEDNYEVWRTDTGMSSGMMSGPLECLEVLRDGTTHVLTKDGVVPAALRMPDVEGDFMDVCEIDTGICTEAPAESATILTEPGKPTSPVRAPDELTVTGMLSDENTKEVQVLIELDDATAPVGARLTVLVERLIVDAIQRQDEGLTKKTVKDMLRKVVGARIVDDNTEFISAEVDRIISSDIAELVAKYLAADMQFGASSGEAGGSRSVAKDSQDKDEVSGTSKQEEGAGVPRS